MHWGGNRHWVPLSIKIQIRFLHTVCQTLFYITLKEYLYENQVIYDSNNVPLPIDNDMQVFSKDNEQKGFWEPVASYKFAGVMEYGPEAF